MKFFYSLAFVFFAVTVSSGQIYEQCLDVNGYPQELLNYYNLNGIRNLIKMNASKEIALIGNSYVFRLSKEGNKLWEINTSNSIDDFAIDKDGAVYILNSQYITKYHSNGTVAWQKGIVASGGRRKLYVDDLNNAYIIGDNYTTLQLVVKKISPNGTDIWTKFINDFSSRDITVNSNGDVYVLGGSSNIGGPYQLVKYNATGTLIWSKGFNYYFDKERLTIGQDGGIYAFLSDYYSTRIIKFNSMDGTILNEVLLDEGDIVFTQGPSNSFYLLSNGAYIVKVEGDLSTYQNIFITWSNNNSISSGGYKSIEIDADGSILLSFSTGTSSGVFIRTDSFGYVINERFFNTLTTGLVIDYEGNYLIPTESECLKKLTPCDKLKFEITSPASKTICASTDTYLNITAMGTGLLFQWYKNYTPLVEGSKYSGVNSRVLSIKAANPVDDSGYFFCEVIDICGRKKYSGDAAINFIQPPAIVTQPPSFTQCAGTEAIFQISTSGGQNVKYQWRKGNTPLTEGTNVIGSKTSKLTLKAITAADAGDYYCDITSDCYTSPITSQKGTLSLTQPPIVSSQPAATTACIGASAIFTVAAIGSSVTYQWRKGGVNLTESTVLTGTKTANLTIKNVTSTDVGDYSCLVTDACGNVVASAAASLSVTPVTQIISQPASKSACAGTQTTFSVTASGTALMYSWKKGNTVLTNNSKYSGATTNVLTISSIAAADEGYYTCTVSNPCGNDIVSNVATLSIATAPSILAKSSDLILCSGQLAYLNVSASGSGLSYQWKKNGVALTAGSGISGVNSPELIIAAAQMSDAGDYTCEVSTGCGTSQTSGVIKLAIQGDVAISSQPISQQGCLGGNISFTMVNSGTVQTYQWKKNGVTITNNSRVEGANSAVLTIKNLSPGDEGQYSCEIKSICGTIMATSGAQLTVNKNPDLVLLAVDCESFIPDWPSLVVDTNNTFGEYVLFEKGSTTPIPDLLSIPKTGIYVIVKNTGECADSVEWNNTCIVTGIEDGTNEITIFPNPSPDLFKISHPPIEKVKLFDQKGVEVMAVKPDSENETTVNGAQLSTGLYHAVFYTRSRRVLFHRIIVNR